MKKFVGAVQAPLGVGLYEALVTERTQSLLAQLPLPVLREPLDASEAPDRLAMHLARVVERALASVDEKVRVDVGLRLARELVAAVAATTDKCWAGETPAAEGDATGAILRAVMGHRPDGAADELPAPLTPLLDTALLTNAPGEPRVGRQLLTEIPSSDRIDVVMAFVRFSGVAPFLEAIRRHCRDRGRRLRLLTTTYTGSTESRALEALSEAGAEVRVSYEEGSTRLHAKSWLFHRETGASTAYIGSSNLTHSAQVTGLEWNVRVSRLRNAAVVEKVSAVFESYWSGGDFVDYDQDQFERRRLGSGRGGIATLISPVELRLEPFQERLLEQVALARSQGRHRNLLVAATGTGKTVMAAVDYARLRRQWPRARLLFVAHREELLLQALATFRQALGDASFGELWVDGARPASFDHVFASIQSLDRNGLARLQPDHFDLVVIDEFHHAAAPSYQRLLESVSPVELLGLTATPERADGLPVLEWFGGRIAAELRLWDAIDQHRLVPFNYFGIHDALDLREVPWRRGRGYDVEGLTRLLTANDVWARRVLREVQRRVAEPQRMRALGFCVSVDHARFMARVTNDAGLRAVAIWSDTPGEDRRLALRALATGALQVIYSVDLFNEGVDVPAVDTLLLLRPTDSPTLFLQQLGRGLRRCEGKSFCTVLDFVGQHRREFRMDVRYRALLGGTRASVLQQVEQGFPLLPAGCHMELDGVARELVLAGIRSAVPTRWTEKADELGAFVGSGGAASLGAFLEASGMELEDIYSGGRGWSDLCEAAGIKTQQRGPHEPALRRACGRLLHVDDRMRIDAWQRWLVSDDPPEPERLSVGDQRLLRMLVASVVGPVVERTTSLSAGVELLWRHPQVREELRQLLTALTDRIEHLGVPLAGMAPVPLVVHARYTRVEILAAYGVGDGAKVAPWQTGVYWAEEARTDLLAFTLDKTDGRFSPTTRYRDYAVSRELVHWESQSVTRADSPTGRRYRDHETLGSQVVLLARRDVHDRAFHLLGAARYARHEGEQPMAVTWRLDHALPGDLFATLAAAVA